MFESTSYFRVRPVSVIREDSVNGGCQSHSGRLLTAVQMSNWGAWLTQFARNQTDTPVRGTVRVIGSEARVAGYKTSATFNRVKA